MGNGPVLSMKGIEGVFFLAIVGLVAIVVGGIWLVWWLLHHIAFV